MQKEFNLNEYMNSATRRLVGNAVKSFLSNPKESLFLADFGRNVKKASDIRHKYEAIGEHIPVFLIASIADSCNLRCAGCYAIANGMCQSTCSSGRLNAEQWDQVFCQASELGVSFILLAGGEPLIEKDVIEKASLHKNIVFPIFTNGTLINKDYLRLFSKHRNLVPVISLEGDEEATSRRRGAGVYENIFKNMKQMQEEGLMFGTSITVTKQNKTEVTSAAFIKKLQAIGCRLVFFVEYVPVDETTDYMILDDTDLLDLEKRIQTVRDSYPEMIFLSFPGDEDNMGGCLAAGRGFFHINPYGSAEPCPFSSYSMMNVKDTPLRTILSSKFFEEVRKIEAAAGSNHKGGCALHIHRSEVESLLLSLQK